MNDRKLAELIFRAVQALGIDVPILSVVVLGEEQLQLGLYGGRIVVYPKEDEGRQTVDDGRMAKDEERKVKEPRVEKGRPVKVGKRAGGGFGQGERVE